MSLSTPAVFVIGMFLGGALLLVLLGGLIWLAAAQEERDAATLHYFKEPR